MEIEEGNMDIKRKQDIKGRAKDINDRSEQFQMLHATYASQEYVKLIVQDFYKEQLAKIKNEIKVRAERGLDTEKELERARGLKELINQNRFVIHIGYMNISDENMARVTKTGKVFYILLAQSLKDKIHKPDGRLDYGVVKKIRELMAHELGHIVLHTKEILAEDGTQGTLNIKTDDQEMEACLFAEELLELRRERNRRIREDGGADKLL